MSRIFCCLKFKTAPGNDAVETNFQQCDLESLVNDFKSQVFNNLVNQLPLKCTELHLKFWKAFNEQKDLVHKKLPNTPKSLQIIKMFLLRAKVLEGNLRYLNDRKSLEVVFELQKKLASQFCSGKITKNLIARTYFKSVKGTYQLHGYVQMNEMIKLNDLQKMLDFAHLDYIQELEKINKNFDFIDYKIIHLSENTQQISQEKTQISKMNFGNEWIL